MRLVEIAPDFTRSSAGVLMTILQHLDSKIGDGAVIPFNSVAELMNNLGYRLTYKDFAEIYNNVPAIANLVSNYNEKTITLGKEADVSPGDGIDSEIAVDQMAKSATRQAMNK